MPARGHTTYIGCSKRSHSETPESESLIGWALHSQQFICRRGPWGRQSPSALGWRGWLCPTHCHHLADRNDDLWAAAASRWRPRRREGGLKVSICHEKILLHPQLGDQPSRDFCTSCRDGNPDSWCRFFSNKLQQKLIKMPYQMRRVAAGGGRPSRQLVHICFEAFIVSFFIAGGVNDV